MLDISVVIGGLVALVAAIFDSEAVALRIGIAALFIVYGLSSFPWPREDRYKKWLAIGCVCFVISGLLSILIGSWWPLPGGLLIGYGVVMIFGQGTPPTLDGAGLSDQLTPPRDTPSRTPAAARSGPGR